MFHKIKLSILAIFAFFAICNIYNGSEAFAYSASLSTSGDINLNVSASGNGANVATNEVTVHSTCPFGYNLSIKGPADTTLYKDGSNGNNADTQKINASAGTITNPLSIIDNKNTWGYSLTSNLPTGTFIGLTSTMTEIFAKNSASGDGTIDYDIIPVHYGVSVDASIEPGQYKLTESATGAYDNVITYFLTTPLDCTTYQVAFNPTSIINGQTVSGTGTMNNQRIEVGVPTNLDQNQFTAPDRYVFKEWNTEQDGSGTSYEDKQQVTDLAAAGGTITLYARWESSAYLDIGEYVSVKMKNIANNTTSATVDDIDTKIKSIARATTLPDGFTPADNNTISLSSSPLPVYIFFDDVTGTMYYYSEAENIYLNKNSNDMFNGASSLTNIDALSSWNTSSVIGMSGMFFGASSLTNIGALNSWDTSSVTYMDNMFNGASSLTNIDALSSWNTSSVTDMFNMFHGAFSLTNIDALSLWNTSSVTYMSGMFSDTSLTNIDALSLWNTSSVTDMSTMFASAASLTNIDGASSWNTSSVTNMSFMFYGAISLTNIDGASSWNTSSVTNIYYMFYGANDIDATVLNGWDVSNVTDKTNAFSCPADKRPSWH